MDLVPNMNKSTHDKLYPSLVFFTGEYCKICGKLAKETKEGSLLIDHRDNNSDNNSLANLQLLCRTCNYIKNPRPSDRVEEYERTPTPEMERRDRLEPQFRKWLYDIISEKESVPLSEIIASGAEIVGASPETIRKYVVKCKSEAGLYRLVEDPFGRKYLKFK